jgi:single-strand DNA-binding protein
MNNFTGMGRLGKDPELRSTQSGMTVCNFSVAIKRRFKNKQTNEYDTDWLNCTAFAATADFISRYFHKGDMIGVIGSVQTRKWDDQDGKTHYATDIIVEQAHFTGGKSEGGGSYQAQQTAPAAQPQGTPFPDADETSLPFDI